MTGILAVASTGVILVFILWFMGKTKTKKEVLFLRPRDKRGERLDVTKETDRSVLCEKSDPVHRFIKIGSAWNFKEGSKTNTRFFGIEGTAYTALIQGGEEVKMGLEEFLKSLWTDHIYNALPQKLRDSIEKDQIGVIIDPVEADVWQHGLIQLSSDDVNDESDSVVLNRFANQGIRENVKQKLLGNLVWLLLGMGLLSLFQNFFGG